MVCVDSPQCQTICQEQVGITEAYSHQSSVRSRRHSGQVTWHGAKRSSHIETPMHAVSDCWKFLECSSDEVSQKLHCEMEKSTIDSSARPRVTTASNGTPQDLPAEDSNAPDLRTKAAWSLVVVLAALLILSVSFNIYSILVRGHLQSVRQRLVLNARSQGSFQISPSSKQHSSQGRFLTEDFTRRTSSSSSGSNAGDHTGPHKHDSLLFLFNALVLGTAVLHVTSLPAFHGLQTTVVIFVLGLGYSLVQEGLKVKDDVGVFGESYDMWMDIDPHLLLFTLLPPLLAGDAMAIDTSIAKRVANQCLYLASVGVLVNGMLTALFLMVYLGWSFLVSLTTGAILCATDPVAVVALLKELGASPTLTVQIQGESLLNDGTAIVLFTVAYNMIQGKEYDTSEIIMFLIRTALMAWGLGLLIGYLFFLWIKAAGNRLNHSSTIIQISLTICCAYWSFVMAEGVFHISGVLSTVAASLTLASKMWPHIVCEHAMHDVWHTFENLGNVVIFFLAGALTGNTMVHIDVVDYVHLLVIYLVLMIIRFGLIFGSRPVLRLLGKDRRPISAADAAVISWGGLRGAVGLALAVQVRIERAADNGVYNISKKDADRILFFVAGVAFLTLVINATSCPALVRKLGISAPPSAKKDLQRMLFKQIARLSESKSHREEVVEGIADMLCGLNERIESTKSLKKGSSFGQVAHNSLEALAHSTGLLEELHENRQHFQHANQKELEVLGIVPSATLVKQETHLEDLVSNYAIDWGRADAVISAFLALVKSAYWHFLETRDMIPGSKEAEVLLTSVAFARSQLGGELIDFDFVFPHAQVGPDEDFLYMINEAQIIRGSHCKRVGAGSAQYHMWHKIQFRFFRLVESAEFNVFFAFTIVLNGIFIAVEDIYRDSDHTDEHVVWYVVEVLFVVAFTIEFVLKLLAYGQVYFFDGWNNFDLLLVTIGVAGLIVSRMARGEEIAGNSDVSNEARIIRLSKILKVARLLRLFRLLRFWKKIQAYLTKTEMSFEVADYMKKMTILQCFVKAHLQAQSEFYKYFCGNPTEEEPIRSVEVARCMLRSQVFVYRAAVLADAQLHELDARFVHEVNCIRESKVVTEELENFVLSAFHKGVLNSREAEAIITPLHIHIKECMQLIQQSASGLTPEQHHQLFSRMSVAPADLSDTKSLEKVLDDCENCEIVGFAGTMLESVTTETFQPAVVARRDFDFVQAE